MSYLLCGMRVESDLPLPDLAAWTGEDRPSDLEIRLGTVPALKDLVHRGPLLQVASDGTCRFSMLGVAEYLVEHGRRIIVQPEMDEQAPDIRLFLLGTVFGFLCHQRGLVPLHAGCVEIGGRAVAFAGVSGAGKSTLTGAFLGRGFPILADDLTVIDLESPEGPTVFPSFPRVKLWGDAMEGLGYASADHARVRSEIEKFQVPIEQAFRTTPLPLGGIYHLSKADEADRIDITELRGIAAVSAVMNNVYRHRAAFHMGRKPALMAAAMRLGTLPNLGLSRGKDLSRLDATVDAIVAHQLER